MLGFKELYKKTPAMEYLYQLHIHGPFGNILDGVYVAGGSFPYSVFETFSHFNKNSVHYFPLNSDVEDVTVDIYETDDNIAWDFFIKWRASIENEDGTYNLPSEFKKPITIYRLGPSLVLRLDTVVNIGRKSLNIGSVDPHVLIRKIIPTNLTSTHVPGPQVIQEATLRSVFGLEYEGAFPKQISEYAPKADGKENLVFTVTFSVDGVKRSL